MVVSAPEYQFPCYRNLGFLRQEYPIKAIKKSNPLRFPVSVLILSQFWYKLQSKKHSEFTNRYKRIKTRRGHKEAIIAIYRMILFRPLSGTYFQI